MSNARAADRIGQVLGGRYRLLAPIGTGASATVYLADDVVLRRRVAVKVLHDALASDISFLKRFQAEARSAAALNHRHIMAVHDWGQGEVPYLVTELLDGGSLRAMLDAGNLLDLAQARSVGVDTATALDYAHRRGFVHRDIKPANLLFDDEGTLRIADFGLARALAEAAWTEPAGAVLGTARYASPEQAQGVVLDGRSDVYSLGLVIIESVTGQLPFTADTTLGTLMARVNRNVPVPDVLGPLVPALRSAGVPNPADRPDAAEFATMLMAAGDLSPVAPLRLAGTVALESDQLDPRNPPRFMFLNKSFFGETAAGLLAVRRSQIQRSRMNYFSPRNLPLERSTVLRVPRLRLQRVRARGHVDGRRQNRSPRSSLCLLLPGARRGSFSSERPLTPSLITRRCLHRWRALNLNRRDSTLSTMAPIRKPSRAIQ